MAEKPAVRPDVAVGEALRAVARDILSEARRALEDQDHSDAVAVHEYRKAMKRWRALLRLLQPFLGDEARRLRIAARDSARELAQARDAQAALDALADVVKNNGLSERTLGSIRGRLEPIRAREESVTLTQGTRARLLVALDVAETAIASWPLDALSFPEIARELAQTFRRARDEAPDADWRTVPPPVLHELRGRVVAHRYQMELIESLWPKFGRMWISEAQRLRERLGALQDLSVLQGMTAAHQPVAPWRSRLAPLIIARQASHAKAAQRFAGRLFAERPRAFRRRIEALWENAKR